MATNLDPPPTRAVSATVEVTLADGRMVRFKLDPDGRAGRLHVALEQSECRRRWDALSLPSQLAGDLSKEPPVGHHFRLDLVTTGLGDGYALVIDTDGADDHVAEWQMVEPPDCCDRRAT